MDARAAVIFRGLCTSLLTLVVSCTTLFAQDPDGALAGTEPLTIDGDIASLMVAGIDRFLLEELRLAAEARAARWRRDFSSEPAYLASIEGHRGRLRRMLGVRDPLVDRPVPRLDATVEQTTTVGTADGYTVVAVRWHAFGDVHGAGLLLEPIAAAPAAHVIAIPDCEVTPEQLAGLEEGIPPAAQYARRLAASGCRVLVPLLVDRREKLPGLSNREWLYRPAFELGRGLVGYELQKILAAVTWLHGGGPSAPRIGVIGWGEGGMMALYAGAIAQEIDVVAVSGYFDSRQDLWQQPIDRNVFGVLNEFGDAELVGMILPRSCIVDATRGPERQWSGEKGAPWRLVSPPVERVRAEYAKAERLARELGCPERLECVVPSAEQDGASEPCLQSFLRRLAGAGRGLADDPGMPRSTGPRRDPAARMHGQIAEMDAHSQRLLRESHYVRRERTVGRLDCSSLAAYEASAAVLRCEFRDEVIGHFERPMLPPRPRTRLWKKTDAWTAYDVVLDVFPDVCAYGLLLIPEGVQSGERRPVVVCQHGLEGRPQDTVGEQGSHYYAAFAARLAERGFVTFAPQNPYIFGDRFRTLQRKANTIGKTLFSIITPQHQQIVDWLQTLPFVDPERIGFYGLSYGGKTAMRVPAIVTDYCLSICSADFNEWVDKNASTLNPRSYADKREYEIFEFDLGSTFNYAEMAALIAPRPFMVERGHFDDVADDWTVGYEYAKVQFLYAAKLKRPDLTEIEWFDGPHRINGRKTFAFLHRHLRWPAPEEDPR